MEAMKSPLIRNRTLSCGVQSLWKFMCHLGASLSFQPLPCMQEGFFSDLPFNTVKFYLPNWTEYCKESTVLWSLWSESLRIRESDKHRDNMFLFQRVPSLGQGLRFQHPKITIITDYSFNSFYVSHPTQWFTTDYSFNSRSDGPSVTGARTSRTPTPILRHYHLLAAKSPIRDFCKTSLYGL